MGVDTLLHLRDPVSFLPLIFKSNETRIGATKLPDVVQLLITKFAQRHDLKSDLSRQDRKGMEDDALSESVRATSSVSPLPKMRRLKARTCSGVWMRLAEAPWGRMIEYSLQACLHDSRLRRHVFHESGFIDN
jgi:hypothetical protein